MAESPDEDFADSRSVLAPTLAATADILPWLARPRPPRFDPALNERWIEAGKQLAASWSGRHETNGNTLRAAVFSLYAIALETADPDCLRLGEALAGAADRLEAASPPARLIAALSAASEVLNDPAGLEHDLFGERVQNLAPRLEAAATARQDTLRSAALDALFVEDAREQIDLMREALATLPPDAYALATESADLAQQAEQLEIWGVMQLARRLTEYVGQHATTLEIAENRLKLERLLEEISAAVAAVDG